MTKSILDYFNFVYSKTAYWQIEKINKKTKKRKYLNCNITLDNLKKIFNSINYSNVSIKTYKDSTSTIMDNAYDVIFRYENNLNKYYLKMILKKED